MNVEEIVRSAMADHVSGVEPRPDGWERIQRGSRRRPWQVPAVAAAAVLTLVAGIGVVSNREPGPPPLTAARAPADLYLAAQGSVWPFQSKADAEAWRRDPGRAPHLAEPERTARAFAETVLDLPAGRLIARDERDDSVVYDVDGRAIEIYVARASGESGPWVVAGAGLQGSDGRPVHWDRDRTRRVTSPVDVRVMPVQDDYTVEVAELAAGGAHVVLGSARVPAVSPGGVAEVRVGFRQPSAGFGVIAVRGYDERGRLVRATYLPISFDEPWPYPAPTLSPVPAGTVSARPGARPASFFGISEGRVVEVDAGTGRILRYLTERQARMPSGLHLTADRSTLYFGRGDGCDAEISSMPTTGGPERVVVRAEPGRYGVEDPALSPDGSRLAYFRHGCDGAGADLVVRSLHDGSEQVIPAGRRVPRGSDPSWSKDGHALAASLSVEPYTGNAASVPSVIDVATARSLDDARHPELDAQCAHTTTRFEQAFGLLAISELCLGEAFRINLYDPATLEATETLLFAEIASEREPVDRVLSFDIDGWGRHVVYVLGYDGGRPGRPRIGPGGGVPVDVTEPVW